MRVFLLAGPLLVSFLYSLDLLLKLHPSQSIQAKSLLFGFPYMPEQSDLHRTTRGSINGRIYRYAKRCDAQHSPAFLKVTTTKKHCSCSTYVLLHRFDNFDCPRGYSHVHCRGHKAFVFRSSFCFRTHNEMFREYPENK